MSRRWVALTLAGVLAVAVGGFAVWTESCRASSPVQALPADVPGGDAYPEHADEAAELDSAVARQLTDIGIDVEPRWRLWESYLEVHDDQMVDRWPHVLAGAVAGDTVVTTQNFSGTGSWCTPEERTIAAYDTRTGASRWVTRWEGESVYDVSLQPGVPGQVLLRDASEHGGGLTSIDADTGETIWHIDVDDEHATTLVTPEWIIVESEDDSDSTLRALNPSTGDELWHVGFDSGSGSPALAGDVVLVDAKTEDGDGKDLVAYGVTTGELRWSAPAELPIELAGGALAAIMATGEGDALRLTALDPRTGEQMWTTAVGRDGSSTPSFRVLHVLDEGVLVAVDSGYVLLDATTGATRWTAPGLVDSAFDADPLVMHDPTRLLLYGQDRLITVNVETGAVSAPSSDDVYVFTTSPTGDVVVTLDTGRVDVLTGGR